MNRYVFESRSENDTERLGRSIAEVVTPGATIALVGPLGAGKTRLARSICESLGVDPAAIASPTFILIHEYEGSMPIYHFDFYRLRSPSDLDALGADEYFASGEGLCLVEWADRARERLPDAAWTITIEPDPDVENARVFRIDIPPEDSRFELPARS
jgi:tRNA threonylcarbamoyladenosine biosynthesis protein TsaE